MKRIFLIIISLLFLSGCSNNEKFYLESFMYNDSKFIDMDLDTMNNKKDNYVLYVYTNFCSLKIPCESIFENVMKDNNISFYQISYNDFKNSNFYEEVKYGPTILIVKEGKIVDYLDAESEKDLNKYQDEDKFEKWLGEYIYLTNE